LELGSGLGEASRERALDWLGASVRAIGDDVAVTVIDERTRVPRLDSSARRRLSGALDRDGVVAASLIGSQARGTVGPLSDVDVGVWSEPDLAAEERLRLRLDLAADAALALGVAEVDVVLLNDATPLMRHRAIRDGVRLVERDPKARVRFEVRGLLDYLDTKPLREELARGLRHRIEEDRLGRR
jgi:predicted nucleotidyltransferase